MYMIPHTGVENSLNEDGRSLRTCQLSSRLARTLPSADRAMDLLHLHDAPNGQKVSLTSANINVMAVERRSMTT